MTEATIIQVDHHGARDERVAVPTVDGTNLVQRGTRIQDSEGVAYVVDRVIDRAVLVEGKVGHGRIQGLTLRREIPKIRGKAARKALKRARRAA